MINIEFEKLDKHAIAPRNAYGNDAGWDLFVLQDTEVKGNDVYCDVRSGIAIAVPDGYYARLVGRSSALRNKGLIVVEGIIDAGFRGELFSTVRPLYSVGAMLKAGESVCQIIIQEVRPVEFVEVEHLPESLRGKNGFGSSDRRETQ